NKVDFETDLIRLKRECMEGKDKSIYIHPQAKSSLKASDEDSFPLMGNVKSFLDSEKTVFLILGDSGAGKSTFNKTLECDLWQSYKRGNTRVPLYIHLPAINRPEHDLITKQLDRNHFTKQQIKEMKTQCEFILICDGYDECGQTNNLYTSNELNQNGQWRAKMIISCRTEYLGRGYHDNFQTSDCNGIGKAKLFQEAVITPFSQSQIRDYIKQYMYVEEKQHWQEDEYYRAFEKIPNLYDLVKNPFLLAMSLEVLPLMVDSRKDLSAIRITRVSLYDQFVRLWLTRNKAKLQEKPKSEQERKAFQRLTDDGFTQRGIRYLKDLAVAIYEKQAGNRVVEYKHTKDRNTWKENFFGQDDEIRLLREACPISRSGSRYQFIHKSLQEYAIARAVYEPKKTLNLIAGRERQDSVSSLSSDDEEDDTEEEEATFRQPLLDTALARHNFVKEPSILQFLAGRAHQEPHFKEQLLSVIEHSKIDETASRAAANAITVLVRAGVQFNRADLQGIRIPGADLSYGVFDSAKLQGADLTNVNLRNVWLRDADLSRAQMEGVQFGESPFLQQDFIISYCAYSTDGTTFAVSLRSTTANVNIYTTSDWKLIRTLRGHTRLATCVVFSPNGYQIASSSADGTARLWTVETGECLHILSGHSDDVSSVVYSSNGSQVASASVDKTVRLWDVETGECRQILVGHDKDVNSAVFSPKDDRIASGSNDKTIRLWDAETGECLHIFEGHENIVWGIAFSPNGKQFASGSFDNTVRLWDMETRECCRILEGHSYRVYGVAYSPKGGQLASSSFDKTVRLWDIETGECHHVLKGHEDCIAGVVYSPNGDRIATCSWDHTVRLWETETGEHYQPLNGHSEELCGVAFSPKGCQVASASRDGTVRLWDAGSGECYRILKGHDGGVVSVDYSPDGMQIASAGHDGTLRLWDVETGECLWVVKGTSIISAHMFSPNGRNITASFSPKGGRIVTTGWDSTLQIWDLETRQCLHVIKGGRDWVSSARYSAKGDQVVGGNDDRTVRLWDAETGESRQILRGHNMSVWAVAFSPDGGQVASGSQDYTVRLWDVNTGECRHVLEGHTKRLNCVAYSPTGNLVASGCKGGTIRLWDIALGQCKAVFINQGVVEALAWKPTNEGMYLVVGSDDASIRLWQVVEENDQYIFRLCWSSTHGALVLSNVCLQGASGLSAQDYQLLKQRGAIGEPLSMDRA
ncbi:hypothetical protein BGX27_003093, partial [Mortierella sp. AM989]